MAMAMKMTTMQLDPRLRDELAEIAKSDFGGVTLAEALARLLREHEINQIMARYEALRADPEAWAGYHSESRLTDSVAGDGLPSGDEEYPEYRQ